MTVVVAQLPTAEGLAAFTCAVEEARRRATQLLVIATANGSTDEFEEARAALADSGASLRVENGTGNMADDLVSAAEQHQADLVVIGLRRRSPVGKLILGSNAQRILLDAPCPVLAVKPDRQ